MYEGKFTIEEVNDPEAIAEFYRREAQAKRNNDWLSTHWGDVLPQALGKFLAVAGQEAFVADTPAEAWAMAKAAHPDDEGAFMQYVIPTRGPRIYGNQWRVVAV